MNLRTLIKHQIELIENGKPLEAFTKFFSDNVIMLNNDILFANNKKKGMELQTEFIKTISEFKATVYSFSLNGSVSTLDIEYSFKNAENVHVKLKGVHQQKWGNELVVREDFYTDEYVDSQN